MPGQRRRHFPQLHLLHLASSHSSRRAPSCELDLGPIRSPLVTLLAWLPDTNRETIREEEQDIFPRISKVWNDKKLKQAGTDMKEMKATKLKLTTVR
jgi:hypothetical protein